MDRPLPVSILLDDVTVAGEARRENLRDAGEGVLRLTGAGAMVGLPKCGFATEECRMLGDLWSSGGYFRPPPDKLTALVDLSDDQLERMPRA